MIKIVYVPLEHLDTRPSTHFDRDIQNYLYGRASVYIVAPEFSSPPPAAGHFLNSAATIRYKSLQMEEIAKLYALGRVDSNTVFFFSDLWFPGIESIAYLNYFYKVKPKITGMIHAGSFTDTDFVRDMERWALHFESILFDICDRIYCGSEFIKQDILKKRIVDERKLIVTGQPLNSDLKNYVGAKKENIVIFNGRLCDEKQPWLFDELRAHFSSWAGWRFISTMHLGMTKEEYYTLLAKSKVVVSYALQENFGMGIAEAVGLGCIPVLPNKLVYPEFYAPEYLYSTYRESVKITQSAMLGQLQPTLPPAFKGFDKWFPNEDFNSWQ